MRTTERAKVKMGHESIDMTDKQTDRHRHREIDGDR